MHAYPLAPKIGEKKLINGDRPKLGVVSITIVLALRSTSISKPSEKRR